jgi:hypothetical protein
MMNRSIKNYLLATFLLSFEFRFLEWPIRNFALSILLQIIFSINSSFALMGFYEPRNVNGFNINKCASKTYKIITPAIESEASIGEIPLSKISKLKMEFKVALKKTPANKDIFDIIVSQLNTCKRERLDPCFYIKSYDQGSGFITDYNGVQTLWTNSHVLENYMQSFSVLESIKNPTKSKDQIEKSYKNYVSNVLTAKKTVRFYIFDSRGLMVLGNNDELYVKIKPEPTTMSRLSKSFYAEDSDFIGLVVPRRLANSLTIGTPARPNQKVYVSGYPSCTGCGGMELEGQSRLPYYPNSNGNGLKATKGNVLPIRTVGSIFRKENFVKLLNENQILFYNSDSFHGQSGGPIFNDECEVVGLHAGGLSYMNRDIHLRISRGVRPPQFDEIIKKQNYSEIERNPQ